MRDYSKISPQFWLCEMGRQLRTVGAEAQLIALYLMSSPHSTMYGIYYIPYLLIAHETGLSEEKVRIALQQLIELKFCSYDEAHEYVWVHDMARCQMAPQLKPNDNRVKSIRKYLAQLPKLSFLPDFYQSYAEDFHLEQNESPITKFQLNKTIEVKKRMDTSELDDFLPSLEEIELPKVDIEVEISDPSPPLNLPKGFSSQNAIAVQFVFEEWKRISHQNDIELTEELFSIIERPLINGFTTDDLKHACHLCIERNPKATISDLQQILSQRASLEAALRSVPKLKSGEAIANQFLPHLNGAPYGAKPATTF